eukprot:COSAG01_NODE_1161_length_11459_cov_47.466549_13_plen_43_part_00
MHRLPYQLTVPEVHPHHLAQQAPPPQAGSTGSGYGHPPLRAY